MTKVLFDTNVLISALFWKGPAREVVDMAIAGKIGAFTSLEILEELKDVLCDSFNVSDERVEEIVKDILSYSHLVSADKLLIKNLCDHKDNKIIAAAAAAKVKYLVTGDKDLLVLKVYKDIDIVTLREFLDNIK
jgi:putative PIN family toxin of toxin-antitoxin system